MSVKADMIEAAGNQFGFTSRSGSKLRGQVTGIGERGISFEMVGAGEDMSVGDTLRNGLLTANGRIAYEGDLEVTGLVDVGLVRVCNARVLSDWKLLDVSGEGFAKDALADLREHTRWWAATHEVRPAFRTVVADLAIYLEGLESWCQRIERGWIEKGEDSEARESALLATVGPQVGKEIDAHFAEYELIANQLGEGERSVHAAHLQNKVHRYILQSPFSYRCFTKPLGYAGDYEMVNLMMMNPFNGVNVFAKLLNNAFLSTGPVVAHRNRISYLTNMLMEEVGKRAAEGKRTRILNLGCGPAQEIRDFIMRSDLCEMCDFELLDFSEVTLNFTREKLDEASKTAGRSLSVRFLEESIQGFLKKVTRGGGYENGAYDLVYCAGLFDYLQQRFCQKLVSAFFELVGRHGLVVVTNVSGRNTIPNVMSDFLEWSIIHRDVEEMLNLAADEKFGDSKELKSDATEINFFLELRKDADRGNAELYQVMAESEQGGPGISCKV